MFDDNDLFSSSFDDSFSCMDALFTSDDTDCFQSSCCDSDCITTDIFDNDSCLIAETNEPSINCANGLPMVGCIDIEGNPYGCDRSNIAKDDDVK